MSIRYDNEFKEKVAKEAIDINNISATAKKYRVNSNSVSKWVKDFKKKFGFVEILKPDGEKDKEVTVFNKEVLEMKTQLERTESNLMEAMTLIGEKDFYIKKLEKSLNR